MGYDPSKQKHHYVPKFYFKLFEEQGHVEVYDIVEKRFHPGSCKDLSFVRNFYEDTAIEKEFSDIDKVSSYSLWKLVNEKSFSKLKVAEKVNVLRFLVFQHMRTPKAKKKYEKFFKYFTDKFVRDLFRKNIGKKPFITKEWVETGTMPTIEGPFFMIVLLNILIAGYFYLADLVPVILINKTDKDFLFSDDPVIFYNSFFNYRNDLDMTYLFSPGLQIFSPLDSQTMLMLYDPKFYNAQGISISKDAQGLLCGEINVVHESDVDALNILQLINCEKSIYFIDKNQSVYIEKLHSSLDIHAESTTYGSNAYVFEGRFYESDRELSEFYNKGNYGYQLHLSFMPYVSNPGATETIGESGFPVRSIELMLMIEKEIRAIYDKYNIKL